MIQRERKSKNSLSYPPTNASTASRELAPVKVNAKPKRSMRFN